MSGFKRFIYVVCGLAGLVGVAFVALSWYGPWAHTVSTFLSIDVVFLIEEVLLAIAAIVLLVTLCKGLFASHKVDVVTVSTANGGEVAVTRDAVASKVTSIVEADGSCIADVVDVSMRSKGAGSIRVHVRIQPLSTLEVIAKGAELHDELQRGLASLCGDRLENITLEFIEPQQEEYIPATMPTSLTYDKTEISLASAATSSLETASDESASVSDGGEG